MHPLRSGTTSTVLVIRVLLRASVIGMAQPQDITLHQRPRIYAIIVPICSLLAALGLFHFQHGPFRGRIISKIFQGYAVLVAILNLALLVTIIVCFDSGESKFAYTCLVLANFINYCFMFYFCCRENRFAAILKALISIKQFLLDCRLSILKWTDVCLMLFLSVGYITIIAFSTASLMDGKLEMFQCLAGNSLKKGLVFLLQFLLVSGFVLPWWLYTILACCTWFSLRTARNYLKHVSEKESYATELTSTVEQVFELVGAMDASFKWFLFFMIGTISALATFSFLMF